MKRTTALLVCLLGVAGPAAAQSAHDALIPGTYAWLLATSAEARDRSASLSAEPPSRRITLNLPQPKLGPLDFGGYEPYPPKAAGTAGNGVNDVELTVSGTPTSTRVGTSFDSLLPTAPPGVAWKARAGTVLPGLPLVGDPNADWRRAPDVQLGLNYKF